MTHCYQCTIHIDHMYFCLSSSVNWLIEFYGDFKYCLHLLYVLAFFFNLGLKLLKKNIALFNITCSVLLHADHIILEEIQPSVAYLNTGSNVKLA